MLSLVGYEVNQQIYESSISQVYRGRRLHDNCPVILKMLNRDYPTPAELARFRQGYNIDRTFDSPLVVRALDLLPYQTTLVMVLEDFGGESLRSILAEHPLPLDRVLKIAIQIVHGLKEIHQSGVIHKDIKPSNIIWNTHTDQIKITDFSISSTLSCEATPPQTQGIEGTPAYMSPEQTGRMNRALDYRSDFYSLGVTLYELLTAKRPFESLDLSELIHCHLARQPVAPHRLRRDIPVVLSQIILKLLAKTAEDRYQSALGIAADLEECLRQWQLQQKIEPFELARHDRRDRFRLSQHLYGRETEQQTLLAAFDRIATLPQARPEVVLITGDSGIGKSKLVQEFRCPVIERRGHFITGRYEQLRGEVPYRGLIQAFQELVQALLAELPEKLDWWRRNLLEALGSNGQVAIEMIPDLERIIGPQPEVPLLVGEAAQNRFQRVFRQLIRVFAHADYPLVIFLDDLQWIDSASLVLLDTVLTSTEIQRLLLVGAYRRQEVGDGHPLNRSIQRWHQSSVSVQELHLQPLLLQDLQRFLANSFQEDEADQSLARFAQLILEKTGGNPFFVSEFLQMLHQKKWLWFDEATEQWQWNLAQIRSSRSTDNVVELLANRIQQLPTASQHALKLAACLGTQFELMTLAAIAEQTPAEISYHLYPALQQGMLLLQGGSYLLTEATPEEGQEGMSCSSSCHLPVDWNQNNQLGQTSLTNQDSYPTVSIAPAAPIYFFTHDRLRQAAYSLVSNLEESSLHYRIGQLLQQHMPPEQQEVSLFDLVNHLNYGIALITEPAKRDELAALNLRAGQKARGSSAFQTALHYFKRGRELLGERGWIRCYDVMLPLSEGMAETAYLCGETSLFEQVTREILNHSRSVLDQVKIYELKIHALVNQDQVEEAIKTGFTLLQRLNIPIERQTTIWHLVLEFWHTRLRLGARKIESLGHLPPMTNAVYRAAIRILVAMMLPAYFSDLRLTLMLNLVQMRLTLSYGSTDYDAAVFTNYGFIELMFQKRIDRAKRFGQLGQNLLPRTPLELRPLPNRIFYGCLAAFSQRYRDILPEIQAALQQSLDLGDFSNFGILLLCEASTHEALGLPLEDYFTYLSQAIHRLEQANQHNLIPYLTCSQQLVANLLGRSSNPYSLKGEYFDLDTEVEAMLARKDLTAVVATYQQQLWLLYLLRDYRQMAPYIDRTRKYLQNLSGTSIYVVYLSVIGLAQIALYEVTPTALHRVLRQQIQQTKKQLYHLAHQSRLNFWHRYCLVEAEWLRVSGKPWQAIEYYEQAIAHAHQQELYTDEALANELTAYFWLNQGKDNLARFYLTDACYLYQRWGAEVKVQQIKGTYPHLVSQLSPTRLGATTTSSSSQANAPCSSSSSTTPNGNREIDLTSVLKASHMLSGEIVLEHLLTALVEISVENAGAQWGMMLRESSDHFIIEAFYKIDDSGDGLPFTLPLVATSEYLPLTIVHSVARRREPALLGDASQSYFKLDPYVKARQPRSVLCNPIISQGVVKGILYLENNLSTDVFTHDRLEVLNLICAQAGISLDNAQLYQTLEQKVEQRTLELAEARDAADRANRAKSEFLAGMSHELRTPLNGILGYAQILQQSCKLDESGRRGVEIIYRCGQHLLTLINDVLDLAKVEAGKIELVPGDIQLSELLMGVAEICEIRAREKNIHFISQFSDQLPDGIQSDEKRLRQVLLNLLGNAIKFTDQGQVTFRVSVIDSPSFNHHPERCQTRLRFAIEDTGIGITHDNIQRLFRPFEQVGNQHKKAEGTGLGLAISQRIIQMMGSQIHVTSQIGQGSTFWFELDVPVVSWQAKAVVPDRPICGYQGDRCRVLVVDDNADNRSFLVNVLVPIGFHVFEAQNGQEGIEQALAQRPHIILSDLVMPVLDGLAMTRQLRQYPGFENLPIVACSASVFVADQQASQIAGCTDFIAKPIQIGELLGKIQQCLQLEWVYESPIDEKPELASLNAPVTPPSEMVYPSEEQLATLSTLARRGLLRQVVREAEQIASQEPGLQPFVEELSRLANGFQVKKVQDLLKRSTAERPNSS